MVSSSSKDSNLLFFRALVVIRGAPEAVEKVARGVVLGSRVSGSSGYVWVPRVDDARGSAETESTVGAGVEELTEEGFARGTAARSATGSLHAILLFLLCRRLPTLACLVTGVESATAGPLLVK